MTARLAFLSGVLTGGVAASGFFVWYGAIILGDVQLELHRLDMSIGKVTGAFDLALSDKIPARHSK
ncbi:hypothetical protein [Rhodopila sp.]|uniref:hypothetical protein n=1 Tax=Rhodopila sp. TaxID=2480087 RepID=UPI003D0C1A70